MKDSGVKWIGEVPEGWEIDMSKHIFTARNTKGNKEAILLSATQLYGMYPQSELEGVVQVAKDTDLQTFKTIHKNDYVISLRSFQGGFEMSDYEGVCSPAYQVFYATKNICHSYFKQLFKSNGFIDFINSLTVGIREGKNIQYGTFSYSYIPIPPLPEQQAIASYLDKKCGEIDSLVGLQEEMIAELKAYKQSVITEAVTKGLDPDAKMKDSGVEWIGEVPEGWEVCKLQYVVSLQSGQNLITEQIADNGDYPVFGGNGIRGYYNYFLLEGDYVLIGRQGALCGNINYAKGRFWPTEHAVVCYPRQEVNLLWLGETLRSMNLGQYSLSAAQPGLSVDRIKHKYIPLPPLPEQQAIATYLDTKTAEIDQLITIKQQKITELKEYKKSLIYECVTGKKEILQTTN